ESAQVEFHGLREARQIVHAENRVHASPLVRLAVLHFPGEGEDGGVGGGQFDVGADAEDGVALADLDHFAGPVEQGAGVVGLGFDVDGLVAVDGVHDDGQVEAGGVAFGEAGVAVGGPLHGGADGVAVAEPDVVAHADFVAVVQDGGAGEGEQEGGEQFELVAVVVQGGGQAAADADVGFHAGVFGVFGVHVVAFFVGDHLQGEFVVVAQEDAPLAGVGDFGGLGHDFGDGVALFAADGHEDAGHDGEVEGHVAFVAAGGGVAEGCDEVGGPWVGFGEEDGVGAAAVYFGADAFEVGVGFGEVFAARAFAGTQVGDGVEAEAVDAQVEPEAQVVQHG